MAKREKKNYSINHQKQRVIASLEKLTENEIKEIKMYLALGYVLQKRNDKAETLDDMIETLTKKAPDVKEDFEMALTIKKKNLDSNKDFIDSIKDKYGISAKAKKTGNAVVGWHLALQIYQSWKKANKDKKEEDNNKNEENK